MKIIPVLTSSLVLLGIFLEGRTRPLPEAAQAFHALVRAELGNVPYRVGSWEGTNVPIPPAAQALLRPNASLSRTYRQSGTGRCASLMIVQCQDTRDMQGHYPPVCYPAHGWELSNPATDRDVPVGGVLIPLRRYEFRRKGFDRQTRVVIYSLFVLPGKGFALDMETVRTEAGDYRTRSFGAAQVQIVMDAGGPQAEEEAAVEQLLSPLAPTIDVLRSGPGGATP